MKKLMSLIAKLFTPEIVEVTFKQVNNMTVYRYTKVAA
jgi:hypothetical protein